MPYTANQLAFRDHPALLGTPPQEGNHHAYGGIKNSPLWRGDILRSKMAGWFQPVYVRLWYNRDRGPLCPRLKSGVIDVLSLRDYGAVGLAALKISLRNLEMIRRAKSGESFIKKCSIFAESVGRPKKCQVIGTATKIVRYQML